MRTLPRWCPWALEPRFPGEQPTKIGYDVRSGRRAKSNDPSTWTTFDRAWRAYQHCPRFRGVFFALGDDAPYVGIDLDDCRDPATGLIVGRARRIIEQLRSYTEISPSGKGVKLLAHGVMPTPDGAGKNYRPPGGAWGDGTGGIEFYRRARFFALTGQLLPGEPPTIEERTEELRRLYLSLYPPRPVRRVPAISSNVDERQRAERCRRYVAAMPPSIIGQRGHDRLLHAACTCVRFGLSDSSALGVLCDFNRRCQPPWSQWDLERKLTEARKLVTGVDVGSMVHRSTSSFQESRS